MTLVAYRESWPDSAGSGSTASSRTSRRTSSSGHSASTASIQTRPVRSSSGRPAASIASCTRRALGWVNADASTLARVSRWCEEQGVLPESLSLGTRTLEDVFLELTGRGLDDEPDSPAPQRDGAVA